MDNVVSKEVNRNQIKFMQWDITKRCNLKCKHCRSTSYYDGADGDKIIDLTTEEVFKTLDDLAKNGVNRIHFLGGEPFMRKDLLEIIRYGNKKGIVSSINTNGTLLTPEIVDEILKSRVYLLTFSLDGASKKTNDFIRGEGVYDKVCNNIRLVDKIRKQRKQYLRIITSPVITKVNCHEAVEFVNLAKDLGLDSIIFTTLRKKGRAKENMDDLGLTQQEELDFAEQIAELIHNGTKQHIQLGVGSPLFIEYLNKKYNINLPILPGGCNSLKQKGFIHPDGSLFPCQELTQFYITNGETNSIQRNKILDTSFQNIWESRNYLELFNLMFNNDHRNKNKPCDKCKYYSSFCFPCPLASMNNTQVNYHYSCIEAIRRAESNNIYLNLDEDILVDSQTIIHKAVHEPNFRNDLIFNQETATKINRFKLNPEESQKLTDVILAVKNRVNNCINNINIKEREW